MSDLARGAIVAVATAGAVVATVGSTVLGRQIIDAGPLWWQSLAARPYLLLANAGIDMGAPGFWLTPLAAVVAGTIWAYVVMWALGVPRRRRVIAVAAIGFALIVSLDLQRQGWWIASLVPPQDGGERLHLLLGLTESTFVVATLTTGVLALALGIRRRAIIAALAVGCVAALGTALAYATLDTAGLRIGGPPGTMVRLALSSTAAGAVAGGAVLVHLLRDRPA